MCRHRLPCLLLAFAGAIVAATATAAADWAPPTTLSTPHFAIYPRPQLAAGPVGELVSWGYQDSTNPPAGFGADLSVAPPGQPFGSQRPVPHGSAGPVIVDLGGGRVAQVILTPSGPVRTGIAVALGTTAGRFGAPHRVTASHQGPVSLAGDARGDVLVAWVDTPTTGRQRRVWVSMRAAGGRFGAPQVVSGRSNALQVAAAVGPQGEMVVAYPNRQGRMLARVRRSGGAWGHEQNLGPSAIGTENDVTPLVSASGEAVVAWYSTQLSEGGGDGPGYTRVAVQPARARSFRAAQLLETDARPASRVQGFSPLPVVLTGGGRAAMVVFTGTLAPSAAPDMPLERTVVRVAYRSGAGFGPPQTISSPDAYADGVAGAAGPNGAIVTWTSGDPLGADAFEGTVVAMVLDPQTHRFGPPEQVSPSEHALGARPVFNPAGRWPANPVAPWTVAWTSRAAGDVRGSQAVVRASAPVCPVPGTSAAAPDPACAGA